MTTPIALTDPAAAGAAARCLAARVRDRDRWLTTDHPSRCGWCDYPTEVLASMLDRWNELVAFDDVHGTYTAGTYDFVRLSQIDQRFAIRAAQELVAEAPPAPLALEQAPAAPADADPPVPDWLAGGTR